MGDQGFLAPPALYDRHVGRYGPALAAALCDLANVRAGQRALDVGSGPGALTSELVRRLGPERVVAVEPSPVFAEACRRRHPGVRVVEGRAEELPVGAAAFDVVLSQLVVNFLTDAPAAVAQMRRAAAPGGRVCALVWDYAGAMTLLRAFWDAAAEVDDGGAAADEGRVMPYCDASALGDLWRAAGLEDVAVGAVEVVAGWESFDELWSAFAGGVGPSGAFTAALDDARREALGRAFHRWLGSPAGPFEVGARAWAAVGVAP